MLVLTLGLNLGMNFIGWPEQQQSSEKISLPNGFESIHLGMNLVDFLAIQKNIVSGTINLELQQNLDPYDTSTGSEVAQKKQLYKEKLKKNVLFDEALYYFKDGYLDRFAASQIVSLDELTKIPKLRRQLLRMAVKKWGRPDAQALNVVDYKLFKHPYYEAIFTWQKGQKRIRVRCPEDIREEMIAHGIPHAKAMGIGSKEFGLGINFGMIIDNQNDWNPPIAPVSLSKDAQSTLFESMGMNKIIAEVEKRKVQKVK